MDRTRTIGPRNLTVLAFFYGLNRDQPAHPMPNQLEAFRIGEQAHINNRTLVWAMILAFGVGIPASFLIHLCLAYQHGGTGITGLGREIFDQRLQGWLTFPTGHDYVTTGFMGLGVVLTGFLLTMKMRFLWWPFHPVGYVLGVSPAEMVYIWVPVLISWAIKLSILTVWRFESIPARHTVFCGLDTWGLHFGLSLEHHQRNFQNYSI